MLIDHIGVALVPQGSVWYIVCRSAGRIAFPLFAFMLAEGYFYTKNFRRYFTRIILFALISELPFDLMLSGNPVDWARQSIFVTLALALGGICLFDRFAAGNRPYLSLLSIMAAAFSAQIFNADYGAYGILVVFIFYRYRGERKSLAAWFAAFVIIYSVLTAAVNLPSTRGVVISLINIFEILSLVPIMLYTRSKGFSSKTLQYFFYAFYPLHMAALYLISNAV